MEQLEKYFTFWVNPRSSCSKLKTVHLHQAYITQEGNEALLRLKMKKKKNPKGQTCGNGLHDGLISSS